MLHTNARSVGYLGTCPRATGSWVDILQVCVIADLSNCRCTLFACFVKTFQRNLTVASDNEGSRIRPRDGHILDTIIIIAWPP